MNSKEFNQKTFKDKDIRKKLIPWLEKNNKNKSPLISEVAIGSYRADIFTATCHSMFAYEIKTYNDSLERYFRDQLPSLAYVGERTHIKPIIIIPELHYEKAKDLYYKYDIDLTIGVITYNDKMTFKRQTNISYTYRLPSDWSL